MYNENSQQPNNPIQNIPPQPQQPMGQTPYNTSSAAPVAPYSQQQETYPQQQVAYPQQPMPPQTQYATQPMQPAQAALKTSYVQMQNGLTVYQTQPVALSWGQDNVITLQDTTTGAVIFSTPVQGIKKAYGLNGQFHLDILDGRTFNLIFDTNAMSNQIKGAIGNQFGLLGAIYSIKKDIDTSKGEEMSDLFWWTENLKRFGVKGSYSSMKNMWIIAGIVGGIFLLIFLLTLLFPSSSL